MFAAPDWTSGGDLDGSGPEQATNGDGHTLTHPACELYIKLSGYI